MIATEETVKFLSQYRLIWRLVLAQHGFVRIKESEETDEVLEIFDRMYDEYERWPVPEEATSDWTIMLELSCSDIPIGPINICLQSGVGDEELKHTLQKDPIFGDVVQGVILMPTFMSPKTLRKNALYTQAKFVMIICLLCSFLIVFSTHFSQYPLLVNPLE